MTRSSGHRRWVAAVRRRWMAVAAVESLGLGAATAAVVGPATLVLEPWLGTGWPAAVLLAIGPAAGAGTAWLWHRWPTTPSAAAVADAWFGWDDLLTTAVAFAGSTDPFAAAVRAMADHHCRASQGWAVPVARLGRRAWVLIAMSLGIPITVAVVRSRSTAGLDAVGDRSGIAMLAEPLDAVAVAQPQAADPRQPARRTGTDDPSQRNPSAPVDEPPTNRLSGSDGQRSPDASSGGHGGHGRVASAAPAASTAIEPPASPTATSVESRDATAGGGTAIRPPRSGQGDAAGTLAGPAPAAADAAPWRSAAPSVVRAGTAADKVGTAIPVSDRDLVRDYFAPDR